MATATTPPPPVTPEKRADWQRKVSDPLERLRGYIRLYISIEGAAVLLLYLALWFWIGLLLDYGFFKLFTLDWVQVLPWGFRAGLLVVLVAGLAAVLVTKVTLRLLREFRATALALVLERRFPKLLGDRLITAVELADPQKAARYGYSQAMIDQTIQDAAERVGQVPVGEAFNWKRLRNSVLMVAGLTLGLFVLAAVGYFSIQALANAREASNTEENLELDPGQVKLVHVAAPSDDQTFIVKVGSPGTAVDVYVVLEENSKKAEEVLAAGSAPDSFLAKNRGEETALEVPIPDGKGFAVIVNNPGKNKIEAKVKANSKPKPSGNFFTDFGNVSAIWFERNILLQNTIWPRRVYLELVGFPEDPNDPDKALTIGKNVGTAPVRVRALKWVYADKRAPEGWRQLMWSDLNNKLLPKAAPPLPAEFFKGDFDWSVDRVEADIAPTRQDVRQKMDRATLDELDRVFENLESLVAQSGMSRTLRKLKIPDSVVVEYKGDTTQSEQTLKREDKNEYAGTLSDLKETVRFRACAVDYCTRARTISVVPPPSLQGLWREESQPAYLYHRAPLGGSGLDLKGLKQHLPGKGQEPYAVYLGGETVRIDLPSGTDLKLTGTTGKGTKDKDLDPNKGVAILPRNLAEFQKSLPEKSPLRNLSPAEAWAKAKNVGAVRILDNRTFAVEFQNITSRLDFDFELTDTDNVVSRRHVVIQAADDVAPEVEVGPSTIVRKTGEGYMITPVAKIPFEGRIRDDHGLNRIVYGYGYVAFDEQIDAQVRNVLAMRIFLSSNAIVAAPLTASVVKTFTNSMKERTGEVPLDSFEALLKIRARGDVPRNVLLERLWEKPPENQLIKSHEIKPWSSDEQKYEGLDLQQYLKELKASGATQPRYRLRVRLSATDTNVETGRDLDGRPAEGSTSPSKETFSFIIVSEDELLQAIAREEGELYDKLKTQGLIKLELLRSRLVQVDGYLRAPDFKPQDYAPQAERTLQIAEGISAAALTAREVHDQYVRILNEMQVNRIEKHVNQVTKVIAPLAQALNNEFPLAEEAQRELHRALEMAEKDPEAAKRVPELLTTSQRRLNELIIKVEQAIEAMGQLKQLNDQIKLAREVLALQLENIRRLRFLQRLKELELFGD
jgi:hypothetical protein